MADFFDENELTPEQRSRFDWAVAEYARIQEQNRHLQPDGQALPNPHKIGPKSSLFTRLLDGKPPLPYPPPTSYSYPWYDIVEKPGKYHVSLQLRPPDANTSPSDIVILNQCPWKIVNCNKAATSFLELAVKALGSGKADAAVLGELEAVLAQRPEFVLTYPHWGEFRLSLGRIIRRGRRAAALMNRFDLDTLDGGNPLVVKVLRTGSEIRAKTDATLAHVKNRMDQPDHSPLDKIMLASEMAILRSAAPEEDDLVEYDCDGWVLERL